MKWTALGVPLLILGVSGCAVQGPLPQQASAAAAPQATPDAEQTEAVVRVEPASHRNCRREAVTGTHFKRNRCISQKQRQRMREEAGEIMDRASPGGANLGGGN